MNPAPSSDSVPPTTSYLTDGVPLSGETATSIAYGGIRELPKWPMDVGRVVKAYVYMDSIFYAADVQCRLANPTKLEDERTLHEQKRLGRLGKGVKDRKLRPCVVTKVIPEAGGKISYLLCPMAGFHGKEGRQSYMHLEKPASLLVRPVRTTYNNETIGTYDPYQFEPEWGDGPQYLFPIQVSRRHVFVTDHGVSQTIADHSFEQLLADIKEVSNVWKKWRNAEHVVVDVDDNSQ